jgi:hypothetical protein
MPPLAAAAVDGPDAMVPLAAAVAELGVLVMTRYLAAILLNASAFARARRSAM